MRLFLAVDIPEELKANIMNVRNELTGYDTKLVEKENLHFTLKFLGEVSEGKMKEVVKAVETIKPGPFSVELKGVGFFPSKNFIRVAWMGAESQEFLDLHVAVNEALAGLFPKEKPVPHLTLARVRSQTYKKELTAFAARHENEEFGGFIADKIALKKSNVTRKGPVYEDVKIFDISD